MQYMQWNAVTNHWARYSSVCFFLLLLGSINPACAADTTAIDSYLRLFSNNVIYLDDVEHKKCGKGIFTPWNPATQSGSTCKKTEEDGGTEAEWPGLIEAISTSNAVSGSYVYRLPTETPETIDPENDAGMHTAKFSTAYRRLLGAQFPPNGEPGIVRYSAYYYVESGFDDTEWHIQMQWKPMEPSYTSTNPKIAWGFHQVPDTNNNLTRQVKLIIRDTEPDLCKIKFSHYTQASLANPPATPLIIPDSTWVKVTLEVKFDKTNGYVKAWQGEAPSETLVAEAIGINTVSLLLGPATYSLNANLGLLTNNEQSCTNTAGETLYWTDNKNFTWGVTNYLGTHSYLDKNRTDPTKPNHVILVDDVEISNK